LQSIDVIKGKEMGLDILIFDKDNKVVGERQITLLLHEKF